MEFQLRPVTGKKLGNTKNDSPFPFGGLHLRVLSGPVSASAWARSARQVWIRGATRGKAKMEALTHIERVGRFRNELRPEPAKKGEHLFPCRIDEGHVGYIDEESHSVKAARHERASVLGVVAGESAFKL